MRKYLLFIPLIAMGAVVWSLVDARAVAKAYFFDIGQGDSAMLSAGKTQLLIDGGPDRSVLNEIGEVMPVFDRHIEYVIVTHPHTDHYRGVAEVLKRYGIGTLIVGVPGEEAEYQAFVELAQRNQVPIVRAGGQRLSLSASASFQIIMPQAPWPERPVEHPNDHSVVGIATIATSRILFTGDAETKEEAQLLRSGTDLDADILKVGHHGSRTSSSPRFLEAVSPAVSVVSAGRENRYGHPTPVTLQNLANAGSRTLRTDQHGRVTVTFSGNGYVVQTER